MTKYIWITLIVILLILTLGAKQSSREPELERPAGDIITDTDQDAQNSDISEPVVSESGNIKVISPKPEEKIYSPLLVKGEARVFENVFHIRLKNSNGEILVEKNGSTNAQEVGEFGSFGELILFDENISGKGVLEVYSTSAKDGSEQDMVLIPIIF